MSQTIAEASTILLVRHGLPGGPAGPDPGLGPEGERQARRLGAWLRTRHRPIAQFAASTYTRARETAEYAVAEYGDGFEVVTDERLREWDSDREHYATPEQIAATPRGRAFAEGRWDDFVPEYDKHAAAARMRAAVVDLAARAPGQVSVAVSHGGVINTLLADVLRAPSPFFFNPGYTSVSRIAVMDDGRIVIESVNDTAHLT